MNYTQRIEKEIKDRKKNWEIYQADLKKDIINKYSFDIIITEEDDFNTDRGFFTNAHIFFKGSLVATISPNFDDAINGVLVESMWIDLRSTFHETTRTLIEEGFVFQKDDYLSLQSVLDEIERVRKEIVKYYSV